MKLIIALCLLLISVSAVEFLRTPVGLVHPDCLYEIDGVNAHIVDNDGPAVIHYLNDQGESVKQLHTRPCKHEIIQRNKKPSSNNVGKDIHEYGWNIWATFQNEGNKTFTQFLSTMQVPGVPQKWSGFGLLYLFPGLQNYNWIPEANGTPPPAGFDIIQPVLQYGRSPDGGSDYWGVASW
eukprot:TRINITY_DN7533_c0_g1_i2.p1 TRINITY_DN7533_c0_g1~~TRINITY_DN7533_c0_g1_i2.p1  ORF type:complete len:180 (-),score=50.83 TRINITY_DN7533_c0_g1_i2:70-609(-)